MEIVIGKKIKEVFDNSDIKLNEFADQLGMVRQNVYRIFERTTIDTDLLIKISKILDHDFFQYFISPVINKISFEEPKKGQFSTKSASDCKQLEALLDKTKFE